MHLNLPLFSIADTHLNAKIQNTTNDKYKRETFSEEDTKLTATSN